MSSGWSTEVVDGWGEVDVFEPSGPAPAIPLLFLHGLFRDGDRFLTLRDRSGWATRCEQAGLRVVCPQGGDGGWTPRARHILPGGMSSRPVLEALRQTLPVWMQQRWSLPTSACAVAGLELGGQGALQLAYRDPRSFPIVVAIAPKVDYYTWWGQGTWLDQQYDSAEAARQDSVLLQVHGLKWPREQLLLCDPSDPYCFDGVTTLVSKLRSSGVPCEVDLETRAGGLSWDYAEAQAERWLEFLTLAIGRWQQRWEVSQAESGL
jgi:pimeloyl-ACP methyl ester carboxylesterase